MTARVSAFEVKGWCPGALRPMQSGDGLIVRVRPSCGNVSLAEMRGIADAAARFGNGHIDLTRRANLQIRGAGEASLGPLQDALRALGLLDERPEAEAVRNILVSPLAGLDPSEVLDMRPIARDLAAMLGQHPETRGLPAKFAFVLDGGGVLPLSGERADIRLLAMRSEGETRVAMGIAGADGPEWLGATGPRNIVHAVLGAIRERDTRVDREAITPIGAGGYKLRPVAIAAGGWPALALPPVGRLDIGGDKAVLGLGAPFGRLEAAQIAALAEALADEADTSGIRLSPWRVFYIPLPDGIASERLMARARSLGFVVEAGDPMMRIQACPGRPACRSAHADTRHDARGVASWMRARGFSGTAHISGCAKGCASSAPADVMLIGVPGGYRMLRNAGARDEGGEFIDAAAFAARLDALTQSPGGARHG